MGRFKWILLLLGAAAVIVGCAVTIGTGRSDVYINSEPQINSEIDAEDNSRPKPD